VTGRDRLAKIDAAHLDNEQALMLRRVRPKTDHDNLPNAVDGRGGLRELLHVEETRLDSILELENFVV